MHRRVEIVQPVGLVVVHEMGVLGDRRLDLRTGRGFDGRLSRGSRQGRPFQRTPLMR
ncbi:hypothetical protein [Streptomyces sp. NPDC002790]|uniref:hypothetical protein n=1 Tax=Streptomyces sp. NPDC002790 TaxID=3154431 RepID=UPI003325E6B3